MHGVKSLYLLIFVAQSSAARYITEKFSGHFYIVWDKCNVAQALRGVHFFKLSQIIFALSNQRSWTYDDSEYSMSWALLQAVLFCSCGTMGSLISVHSLLRVSSKAGQELPSLTSQIFEKLIRVQHWFVTNPKNSLPKDALSYMISNFSLQERRFLRWWPTSITVIFNGVCRFGLQLSFQIATNGMEQSIKKVVLFIFKFEKRFFGSVMYEKWYATLCYVDAIKSTLECHQRISGYVCKILWRNTSLIVILNYISMDGL